MDESLLTGESDSVREASPPLLSGTFVIAGRGLAILTRVGTERFPRIVAELSESRRTLQIFNALDKLIKIIV